MENDIKRFFIFANNRQTDYKDLDNFLYNHPDYNTDQSVCIFFNEATRWSLKHKSAIQAKRKWLIVRPAFHKDPNESPEYLGLNDVNTIDFERFYICPELIAPDHNRSNLLSLLYKHFDENDIDITKWRHFKYACNAEQTEFKDKLNEHIHPAWRENPRCEQMTGNVRRQLTSGLWFYIYAKQEYPNSKITMLYFSNRCSKTHSEKHEREYFLKELKDNNLEAFNSFV